MAKRYKVRFNLGLGENFMKWKVEDTTKGTSIYYDPKDVTLLLTDCKLRNQKGTANKIYNGQDKTVCAWVDVEEVKVLDKPCISLEGSVHLKYNPRELPYWNKEGKDIDNTEYKELFTSVREIKNYK